MKTENHNNFTLVRLILSTLVVFGHFKTLPNEAVGTGIFSYADFAVDAFFVVSGYLVFASFERHPAPVSFYIRRMFRVYPLYAVTVLLQALAMAIVAGGILEHAGELLRYLAFNLVFANFLAHDIGGVLNPLHNPGINPSLWTLKIEVAFYLLLPLFWHMARRWKVHFFVVLYLASTAFAEFALYYLDSHQIAKQLPGQLRFFAVGMALYHYQDRLHFPLKIAIPLALSLFALCTLRGTLPLLAIYPLCVGLLVFICTLRLPALPLRFDISYGVYLFHGPLIQFSLLLGVFEDSLFFLSGILLLVYVLAFLADRYIEQPGIEMGKHLAKRWGKKQ